MHDRKVLLKLGIPLVLAASLAFGAACGGDDDGGGGGTGSDAGYVKEICVAVGAAQKDIEKLIEDPKLQNDDEKAAKALLKPLETFLAAVKKANPPKDVKDAHNDRVKELSAAVADLKKGKTDSLDTLGESFSSDPKVKARLKAAAAKEKSCQGLDVFEES